MSKSHFFAVVFTALFLWAVPSPSQAAVMSQVNWLSLWGNINPETGIPNKDHDIKSTINGAVNRCGVGNTNYNLIKIYAAGTTLGTLFLIDPSAYFTAGQLPNCDMKPCLSGYGCYLTIMGPEVVTTSTAACTGASNETLIQDTATSSTQQATTKPDSTTSDTSKTKAKLCTTKAYYYQLIWEERVLDWNLLSLSEYGAFRVGAVDTLGNPKYRSPYNGNPILRAHFATGCSVDEMDMNNDGVIEASETCNKYYQLVGNVLKDLYSPTSTAETENDTRLTTIYYDRSQAKIEEKGGAWRATGVRLENKSMISIQIPDFQGTDTLVCKNIDNTSGHDYFVPTRTDEEMNSFFKSIEKGALDGTTITDCTRQYTPWVGTTACPALACGQTVTIVAERHCQRSSSAYGECSECGSDPCYLKQTCSGGVCPRPSGGDHGGGGGCDCLKDSELVLMKDGRYIPISQIAVGDEVMAFRKEEPLASLYPAKVLRILETDVPQPLQGKGMTLNGVVLTGGHVLPVADERKEIFAADLSATDSLVGVSGEKIPVGKIEQGSSISKVYNLALDQADGYVVNGFRVMGTMSP